MQDTAVWGINIQKVLKAKSGGQHDFTKNIELSMKREFFTMMQYGQGIWWGLIIGLFAGMVIITAAAPNLSFDMGDQGTQLIGVLLLVASIVYFVTINFAHSGITKCVGKDYKTKLEPKYWGKACMSNQDCTASDRITPYMCTHPSGRIRRFMHGPFKWIFLLFGIGAYLVTSTGEGYNPQAVHTWQAVIYGLFTGTIMIFIFSNG